MTTAFELVYVRKEEEPVLAPPTSRSGVVRWLMARLFSSTTNAVLTVLCILLLVWIIPPLVRWAFVDAVWSGKDRDVCLAPGAGACWAFVRARFGQFMYGRYPVDERWRVNLTGILLVIGLIPMAIPRVPFKRENAIYLLILFPIAALILLTGGHFDVPVDLVAVLAVVGCLLTGIVAMMTARDVVPLVTRVLAPAAVAAAILIYVGAWLAGGTRPSLLKGGLTPGAIVVLCGLIALAAGVATVSVSENRAGARSVRLVWWVIAPIALLMIVLGFDFHLTPVETPLWGGLLVTLVVAIVGIVASMPIGVVLALGRRSNMPVVRVCSTGFIEFVRGVPLITVLFMASVMLPVFLPPGVNFDKLLRALIGVALFSAAYMAEVVRGGLQAIPRGQYEAAHAVGLKYGPMMRLIILPQALKIVIPGIVNSFISLFKDTSLVLIIGIFDLLGIVQQGFSDANWAAPQTPATGYAFAGLVFWVFCFTMSRYSIYTERRLHTGHKH